MSTKIQQDRRDSPFQRVQKDQRQDYRAFINAQVGLPDHDQRWRAMCESLQRQAHGFVARFASAYAHQVATPPSERIDVREAPNTAFVFVDDPADSNKWGHVVGKWGKDEAGNILVSTNDADGPGVISIKRLDWFEPNWGDRVQFATLWFGPDTIPLAPPPEPKPTAKQTTEAQLRSAIDNALEVIELMRKALRDNKEAKHPAHEKAIKREIADQQETIENLRRLLP